jgi:molybdopterin adenylyltransferase
MQAAVLVTSDSVSKGEAKDESGVLAVELLSAVAEVVEKRVVPDEAPLIREALLSWSDKEIDVVITIGGTGLSPRDVTAETTHAIIEKEARGISTALIVRGLQTTPCAMLSGATAGVHNRTLIINLPGSKTAVQEYLEFLIPVLPHALSMVRGKGHAKEP